MKDEINKQSVQATLSLCTFRKASYNLFVFVDSYAKSTILAFLVIFCSKLNTLGAVLVYSFIFEN